jgi:hypothetical protein
MIEMLRASGVRHEVGTLILPLDLWGEEELTPKAILSSGIPHAHLTAKEVGIRESGDAYLFSATLANIFAQNSARIFVAVSYLKVGDSYLATSVTRSSLRQAALALLSDLSAPAEQREAAREVLDGAVVMDASLNLLGTSYYVSPYAVSLDDGNLTVRRTDGGAIRDGDISVIVIGDTVYTRGWTVEGGLLIGRYAGN